MKRKRVLALLLTGIMVMQNSAVSTLALDGESVETEAVFEDGNSEEVVFADGDDSEEASSLFGDGMESPDQAETASNGENETEENEVEDGENNLDEETEMVNPVLSVSNIFCNYPDEPNAPVQFQTETNKVILENVDLLKAETLNLLFSMKLQENKLYAAGDTLKISLPDHYLIPEEKLNGEAVILREAIDSETEEKEMVSYSVIENEILICFESDIQTSEEAVYLDGIEIGFGVNREALSCLNKSEYGFYADGSEQADMILQLPEYPVISGIFQGYSFMEGSEENEDLLKWHIEIGTETEGCSLNGYTLEDTIEGMDVTLLGINDENGNDISVDQTEQGFRLAFPDESVSPYVLNAIFALPEECEESVEVVNKVQLLHPEIQPCADALWSDEVTVFKEEAEKLLSWDEFYAAEIANYDKDSMSEEDFKQLYIALTVQYETYREDFLARSASVQEIFSDTESVPAAYASNAGTFGNDYIEVAVASNGKFTIGTRNGDPDFDTDNYKKLLYGHPSPSTSSTLIKINEQEYTFNAEQVYRTETQAVAVMNIPDHNVTVTETLSLCSSGNVSYQDAVKIEYTIQNNGSAPINAGVRIMLDTMLANHDDAPFRLPSVGNVTKIKTVTGNNIPMFYQVYDTLNNPTTLATGYLITPGNRRPDKVQFTNWGGITGSPWSHSPTEGGYLGDSAVGIYFNPVSIGSGSTTTVNTYYGVGLGQKGNFSGEDTLDSAHVKLKVLDSITGQAIGDALVTTADGTCHRSNVSGTVRLLLSAANNKTIRISKSGYIDSEITRGLEGGREYTVKLKRTGDTTPIIKEVWCNGVNLLTNSVEFCEDESNIIDRSSNASKIYNTRIEATVDVPGCTYYLYEENEQLARNQTGVFELKTMPGNNGDWPYIDTLSAGKRFYIRCVSPDGKETKEQILLKVYSPTLALHSDLIERIQKENFNILPGSISDLQNNLFLNILAGPGENKFKIKAIDSDIICKLDIEDKTLKLGINTEENFLDSQEAQNLYKNGVNKAWRNQGADEKTKKANEKAMNDTIKRWAKKKKSQYVIGALKAGVNFMGYGEFKLTDENAFAGTLYFAISGEYDANASLNFPPSFIPVPTYITIGSDGKLELKVIGPVNFEESDNVLDVLYELLDEYTADIGVSVEVGAGNSHTVKVGGKLRGGFEFQYNYKSTYYRLRANAKGSIEAKAFLWEWSFPLAETSWLLHDGYQKSGKTAKQIAPLRFEDIVNDANATLVTRDYLSLDSASTGESGGDITMSNVYTQAFPYSIAVNGRQYRFWLQDIESREAQNRTALVYSVDSGEPIIVDDDGTADFSYSVAVDGDDIYVAWMDCNKRFGTDITMTDTETSLDISMAKIDASGIGNPTKFYQISNDSVLDQLPAVYAKDGTVYIAWNSMDSGFFEEVSGNKLKYRCLSGETLTETKVHSLENKVLENVQIKLRNGVPTAVYTSVAWDDLATQNTQETHYLALESGENNASSISGAQSVPYLSTLNGQDMLFWYQNGNICYTPFGEENAAIQYVFTEENAPSGLTGNFTIVPSDEKNYLVWVDALSEDSAGNPISRKAYASVYQSGTWSNAYQIAELGVGNIENLTGILDTTGNLKLFWQLTAYDEDGKLTTSNLMEQTIGEFTDLVLKELIYDVKGAGQGENYTFQVILRNNGNTVIDRAEVKVEDAFAAFWTDLGLQPGEEIQKDLAFTVPYTGEHTYTVTVAADNDKNNTNNQEFFAIGHSMLRMVAHNTVLQSEGEVIPLEIINDAGYDTDNITLRIFADEDASGVLLYQTKIASVSKNGNIFVPIPVTIFDAGNRAYAFLSVEQETEQVLPTELYYDSVSMRELKSHNFSIQAGEGGSITGSYETKYTTEDEITLAAQPNEGYAFWKWTCDKEVEFDNANQANTTFIMPDEDVVLNAEFRRIQEPTKLELPRFEMMDVGENVLLNAEVTPADTSEHFEWKSSDPSVAEVDMNGNVRALSAGNTVITVTCGTLSKECRVWVKDVAVTDIELITPVYMRGIGSVEKMQAELTPSNATQKVTWSSSNPNVATVEQDGTVTATGCGTVKITAETGKNKKAECEVYVTADLEKITLSKSQLTLKKDDTEELSVNFTPAGISDLPNVTWTVTDSDIVSIEPSGTHNENVKITALGTGSTLITAAVGSKQATCSVTVEERGQIIRFDPNSVTLEVGSTEQLNCIAEPAEPAQVFTFVSDNTEVATVDATGKVTAVSEGTAVISADTENGLHAECTVTVTPAPHKEHEYEDTWTVEVQPTCTQKGSKSRHCKVCEATTDTMEIPMIPHQYGSWIIDSAPTCGSYGFQHRNCIACGHRQEGVIPATGIHSFGEWVITKQPTVSEDGEQKRTCRTCGCAEVEKIDKLQPLPTDIPEKIEVSSIKLNTESLVLENGKLDTLEATVTPDNADNKEVIWESSDTSVITVTENGLVKAVGVGSAEIICTANDGSGTATTCKVTVNPAEPKLMKAVSAGYDRVTITWNKVKDVTGYAVYQKEGNRWKKVRIVNSEMNSYTVKGLTCGKDYTFTVKAYSKVNGEIYKSKYNKKGITGKPIPSTPSIRYLKSYESGIKVAWRPVAGASGYIVYRQIGPNSWKRIARIDDGSAGSYFDRKVRNGKNYTYTLRAYKRVGKKNIYSNYDRTGKTVKK